MSADSSIYDIGRIPLANPITDLSGGSRFFSAAPNAPNPVGSSTGLFSGRMHNPEAPFGEAKFPALSTVQVSAQKSLDQGDDCVRIPFFAVPWRNDNRAPLPQTDLVMCATSPLQYPYKGAEVVAASIPHTNELINANMAKVIPGSGPSFAATSTEAQKTFLMQRYSGSTIEEVARKWRPLGLTMAENPGLSGNVTPQSTSHRVDYSSGRGLVPFTCNVEGVSFMTQRFSSSIARPGDQIWCLLTETTQVPREVFSTAGQYVGVRQSGAPMFAFVLFSTGDSDLPPVCVDVRWSESDQPVTTSTGDVVKPFIPDAFTKSKATLFDPSASIMPDVMINRQLRKLKASYQTVEFNEKTGLPYLKTPEKDPEDMADILWEAAEFGSLWQIGIVHKSCSGVDYQTRMESMFIDKPGLPIASVCFSGKLFS